MSDFKLAQRVRVVDNDGVSLDLGSRHYIVGVSEHSVMLEGGNTWYLKWRFEHEPPTCPRCLRSCDCGGG